MCSTIYGRAVEYLQYSAAPNQETCEVSVAEKPYRRLLSSKPVICVDCLLTFERTSNRQLRCRDCKVKHKAKKQALYRKEHPDKIKASNSLYREKNSASLNEKDKVRYHRMVETGEIKLALEAAVVNRKKRLAKETDEEKQDRLEYHRLWMRNWRENNPDASKEYSRSYYNRHSSKFRSVAKTRYKLDPLGARVSAGIRASIRGEKAGRRWSALVGYTADQLEDHIKRQFLPGMSMENRHLWHIDHITPLSSFKYTSVNDEDFKAAWSLTNLRPIWAKDNQRKSDKRVFLL